MLSLVCLFDGADHGIDLRVISSERYSERFAAITGDESRVVSWPFPEIGTITAELPGRLNRIRALPGVPRVRLDRAIKAVRGLRAKRRTSTARSNDAILRRHGVSVVHFSYPRKFATSLPYVFEPHDLQHRHFPENFSAEEYRWREASYAEGCKNAAFVVCGSMWTKLDVQQQYGVPSERVAVIPRSSVNALPELVDRLSTEENELADLPKSYAIYPATTFAHKNHIRLLRALASLRDRHGIRLHLVCTGRLTESWFPKIRAEMVALGLCEQVVFLGEVSRKTLDELMRGAAFVVFPSLFEGLSQALLEALANQVPIVAASQTSVPETVGDAALYFNGMNTDSIVDALANAVRNPGVLSKVRSHADIQFARYSWKKASATLAACYKRAAGCELTPADQQHLEEAVAQAPGMVH